MKLCGLNNKQQFLLLHNSANTGKQLLTSEGIPYSHVQVHSTKPKLTHALSLDTAVCIVSMLSSLRWTVQATPYSMPPLS